MFVSQGLMVSVVWFEPVLSAHCDVWDPTVFAAVASFGLSVPESTLEIRSCCWCRDLPDDHSCFT